MVWYGMYGKYPAGVLTRNQEIKKNRSQPCPLYIIIQSRPWSYGHMGMAIWSYGRMGMGIWHMSVWAYGHMGYGIWAYGQTESTPTRRAWEVGGLTYIDVLTYIQAPFLSHYVPMYLKSSKVGYTPCENTVLEGFLTPSQTCEN